MPNHTIRLFLASASDLAKDREQFEIFIYRKNEKLNARGLFIHLEIWEDFLDAMSKTRLHDEYKRVIRESDLFVMLFHTRMGPHTHQEFETVFRRYKATNKPRVFTYFNDTPVKPSLLKKGDQKSVSKFQQKLNKLGHFWNTYDDIDSLKHQFSNQLSKLESKGFFDDLSET